MHGGMGFSSLREGQGSTVGYPAERFAQRLSVNLPGLSGVLPMEKAIEVLPV